MFGLTNGDGKRAADQPMDDMKKARYDVQPSKVLHVRPVPRQTTNQDLINLFAPYAMGGGVKVFISQSQGHAFVELPDVSLAAQAIQHTSQQPLSLYGVQLQIEFSSRQEVSIQEEPTPNRVILASVTSLVYPVDLELLHTLFGKYGNILRMATFNRMQRKDGREQPTLQCLIEFSTEPEATAAMQALHGRCIYAGCNELEVQYSKLTQLTARSNNENFRDFTNPAGALGGIPESAPAPAAVAPPAAAAGGMPGGGRLMGPLVSGGGGGMSMGGGPGPSGMGGMGGGPVPQGMHHGGGMQMPGGQMGGGQQMGGGGHGGMSNQMPIPQPFAAMDSVTLASMPNQQILQIIDNHRQQVMFAQKQGMQVVTPNLMPAGGMQGGPGMGQGGPSTPAPFPKELVEAGFEAQNRDQTPVVMIHNLPTVNMDARKLFNIFSIYGNVHKVKILYNKPDTAMIQFSDPFYATLAAFFTNGITVDGSELVVQFSKNKHVSGGGSTDEAAAAKNMTAMPGDQRYGENTETANRIVRNACRPTNMLFVANFEDDVDAERLHTLFSNYAMVKKITMLQSKEGSKFRMANVAVSSPPEAVACVMNLHGMKLGERELKVAFSKSKYED
mmetsp:Transcript_41511/g.81876  ORF Transcript_41511/g.81876 Transcript_41511/m.81876 type:complete len:614 (+) Transcript_41511:195-2036(+)